MSSEVKTHTTVVPDVAASQIPWRWVAMGVFIFSDVLNSLDRFLLAALAPTIKTEFQLSNTDYGFVVSAFAMAYMLMAPITGLLVDRFGLNRSISVGVTLWSLAGIATSFVRGFPSLLMCRIGLGISETTGIPSASKAAASYLQPRELGLGTAFNGVGFTAGAIAAPLLVAALVPLYGWRVVFLLCGLAGLVWVPIWLITARLIPPQITAAQKKSAPLREVLSDRRLWVLALANILLMTPHSLWFNWTTIYFVQQQNMTQLEANQYFTWIPPIFATLGGFFGGWLGFRAIRKGAEPIKARMKICTIVAPMLIVTAAIPMLESSVLAAAGISLSFFLCLTVLSNLHSLPIDMFGMRHAAFTASVLAFSYALLQTFFSPIVGAMVDNFGFGAVCATVSVLPMTGILIVRPFMKATSKEG